MSLLSHVSRRSREVDLPSCPLCESSEAEAFLEVQSSRYFSCPACQLIYLDPSQRLSPDEERGRYDLHENDPNDLRYRQFLAPLVASLLDQLRPGSSGLDFGSGPGPAIPVMFGERGFRMETYDPYFSLNRKVLETQYDFITCSETIEHTFAPGKEFRLFDALLTAGGWLGLMTTFFDDRDAFETSHYRRDPTHVCFFSQKTFEFVGSRFGWKTHFPRRNVVLFQKPSR